MIIASTVLLTAIRALLAIRESTTHADVDFHTTNGGIVVNTTWATLWVPVEHSEKDLGGVCVSTKDLTRFLANFPGYIDVAVCGGKLSLQSGYRYWSWEGRTLIDIEWKGADGDWKWLPAGKIAGQMAVLSGVHWDEKRNYVQHTGQLLYAARQHCMVQKQVEEAAEGTQYYFRDLLLASKYVEHATWCRQMDRVCVATEHWRIDITAPEPAHFDMAGKFDTFKASILRSETVTATCVRWRSALKDARLLCGISTGVKFHIPESSPIELSGPGWRTQLVAGATASGHTFHIGPKSMLEYLAIVKLIDFVGVTYGTDESNNAWTDNNGVAGLIYMEASDSCAIVTLCRP